MLSLSFSTESHNKRESTEDPQEHLVFVPVPFLLSLHNKLMHELTVWLLCVCLVSAYHWGACGVPLSENFAECPWGPHPLWFAPSTLLSLSVESTEQRSDLALRIHREGLLLLVLCPRFPCWSQMQSSQPVLCICAFLMFDRPGLF